MHPLLGWGLQNYSQGQIFFHSEFKALRTLSEVEPVTLHSIAEKGAKERYSPYFTSLHSIQELPEVLQKCSSSEKGLVD